MFRRLTTLLVLLLASAGCRSNGEAPQPTSAREPPAPSPSVAVPAPIASAAASARAAAKPVDFQKKAEELAQKFIILDGHIDVPYRLEESRDKQGKVTEDIAERTPKGNFDYPRAKAGGLDVPFMSIYVPAKYEAGGAKKFAEKLIALVEGFVEKNPDKFALARSPAEVQKNSAVGKISLAMGMENGSPIEKKLENVKYFHDRGIRYITLAHSKDNHISDSSYDDRHTNKGLSPFGKQVVAEMNRVGIMIDVSHISDDAFWQVVELSKLPVIASHSSCRHFTPGWPRNMSDEMIQALGKQGGVIQINFGSGFVEAELQKNQTDFYRRFSAEMKKQKIKDDTPEAKALREKMEKETSRRFSTVDKVADHIDRAVKLAGIDHVGLGSDFDGLGDTLPEGLKDVSQYPNLIRVLLERGYSDSDIEKICGANVLRVWQAVEDYARVR